MCVCKGKKERISFAIQTTEDWSGYRVQSLTGYVGLRARASSEIKVKGPEGKEGLIEHPSIFKFEELHSLHFPEKTIKCFIVLLSIIHVGIFICLNK